MPKRTEGARRPRGRESLAAKRARTAEIVSRLQTAYPDAKCSLDFGNAYELLVATILSAQCTDERVNMVTPALFRRYPTPEDLAAARPEELEEMIRSTGFFRNKAKSLLGMATAVSEEHGGQVPADFEAMVKLPGVGDKRAQAIVAMRERLGGRFRRIEDLMRVRGIGFRSIKKLKPLVVLDPPKPQNEKEDETK